MPGVWRVPSTSYAPPNYLLHATFVKTLNLTHPIKPDVLTAGATLLSPTVLLMHQYLSPDALSDPATFYNPIVVNIHAIVLNCPATILSPTIQFADCSPVGINEIPI